MPPVSDGSGRDRAMLREGVRSFSPRPAASRRGAACSRPTARPSPSSSSTTTSGLRAAHQRLYRRAQAARHRRRLTGSSTRRSIRTRQKRFDFDMVVSRFSTALYPDEGIKQFFSSKSAGEQGSYNLSGVASPAIDALLDKFASANDWDTLRRRGRALDRVLRVQHFWVPQWNKPVHWFAYWDMLRPAEDRGEIRPRSARAPGGLTRQRPPKSAKRADERAWPPTSSDASS